MSSSKACKPGLQYPSKSKALNSAETVTKPSKLTSDRPTISSAPTASSRKRNAAPPLSTRSIKHDPKPVTPTLNSPRKLRKIEDSKTKSSKVLSEASQKVPSRVRDKENLQEKLDVHSNENQTNPPNDSLKDFEVIPTFTMTTAQFDARSRQTKPQTSTDNKNADDEDGYFEYDSNKAKLLLDNIDSPSGSFANNYLDANGSRSHSFIDKMDKC